MRGGGSDAVRLAAAGDPLYIYIYIYVDGLEGNLASRGRSPRLSGPLMGFVLDALIVGLGSCWEQHARTDSAAFGSIDWPMDISGNRVIGKHIHSSLLHSSVASGRPSLSEHNVTGRPTNKTRSNWGM